MDLALAKHNDEESYNEAIQSILSLPSRELDMLYLTVVPRNRASTALMNKHSQADLILGSLIKLPLDIVQKSLLHLKAFPEGAQSLFHFCHANQYARDTICDKDFWKKALHK